MNELKTIIMDAMDKVLKQGELYVKADVLEMVELVLTEKLPEYLQDDTPSVSKIINENKE